MRPDRLSAPSAPEQWAIDAGRADVAELNIPPHAQRDRHFEIFCSLRVACPADIDDAWQMLRVLVNGALHWTRRLNTHPDGSDSLDYRFRHTVPVGEALRIVATSEVHRATRMSLSITAEEELPG